MAPHPEAGTALAIERAVTSVVGLSIYAQGIDAAQLGGVLADSLPSSCYPLSATRLRQHCGLKLASQEH